MLVAFTWYLPQDPNIRLRAAKDLGLYVSFFVGTSIYPHKMEVIYNILFLWDGRSWVVDQHHQQTKKKSTLPTMCITFNKFTYKWKMAYIYTYIIYLLLSLFPYILPLNMPRHDNVHIHFHEVVRISSYDNVGNKHHGCYRDEQSFVKELQIL